MTEFDALFAEKAYSDSDSLTVHASFIESDCGLERYDGAGAKQEKGDPSPGRPFLFRAKADHYANCASSVEPFMALVLASPPVITVFTSSK